MAKAIDILLVEDNPGDQRIFSDTVLETKMPCRLSTVSSAYDALKFLETKKPKLIVLDVMMPGINGHQLFNFLKFNAHYTDITILFLTTQPEENSMKWKDVYYIKKPCSAEDLKNVLAKLK